MARYLKFDRKLYGVDGTIPLTRGDDWLLTGTVIELDGANQDEVDLTGASGVTAFFPGATGDLIGTALLTDRLSGKFSLELPAALSAQALLSDAGVAPYVTLLDGSGLNTLTPFDQPLQIRDRGYTQT